jgi:hypothetical protein
MSTHERNFAGPRTGGRVGAVRFLALLAAAAALGGCARRYDLQLTNGQVVTNVRKAKVHQGYVSYVDGAGKTNTLPSSRVTSIAPHKSLPADSQ